MSELKAFNCVESDVQEFCEPRLAYLKSEADKVIADLEESHKKEVEQLLMEIVELKGKYKELAKLHDKAIQACCDADKVIAEKDEEIAELKEQYKDMDVTHTVHIAKMNARIEELEEQLKNSRNARKYWRKEYLIEYKECCHHKYKRCLAMARWCHNQKEIYERDSYNWELEDDAVATLRNKANIMRKWNKRWLKIAENFKEAK